MQLMNIALVSDTYLPSKNGVATVVMQLKRSLEKMGHQVFLFTPERPQSEPETNVIRVRSRQSLVAKAERISQPNTKELISFCKKNSIQVIHNHTEFKLGKTSIKIAQQLNIPIVATFHTMWEDYYKFYIPLGFLVPSFFIRKYLIWFFGRFNAVIAVSDKVKTYIHTPPLLPWQKVLVIPNALDKSRFMPVLTKHEQPQDIRATYNISDKDCLLLYVGRISHEKRILELLHVAKKIIESRSSVKMLFVGDGSTLHELKNHVKKWNLENRILFSGFVNWQDVHTYYKAADIFTTASLSECDSMTVLEALLSQRPIVARNDAAYTNRVHHNHTGFLSDTDDQMIPDILRLIDDPALRKKFQENSRALAQNLTPEIQAKKHLVLYNYLIEHHNSADFDENILQEKINSIS